MPNNDDTGNLLDSTPTPGEPSPTPVTVPGTLTSEADGAPLAGITVEAILTAKPRSRPLRSVDTDARGGFVIAYDPAAFPDWATPSEATISLRLQRDGVVVPVVAGRRQWQVGREPDRVDLVADVPQSEEAPRLSGTVRHTDGTPLVGVTVEAVELTVTGEEVLASTTTTSGGHYRFDVTSPLLFVRVAGPDGRAVAASPPVQAETSVQVDVYVRDERMRGASDFRRVDQAVGPWVADRDLSRLDGRSVGFLARKTGLHRKQITPYLLARRQAERTGVGAEALYGLIRTGGTRAVGRLLHASEATVVRRLASAGAANIVSLDVGASGAAVYTQLRASLAREATSGTDRGAFGSLLRTTTLDDGQRSSFVARHLDRNGGVGAFWSALRADPAFGDAAVDDVQQSLQLGILTGNHPPLVAAVRSDPRVGQARDVVRFTAADWLTHLRNTGTRPTDAGYVKRLVEDVERAWPTAYVTEQMRGDTFDGKDLLVPFLDANPDFDLGRTSVRTWFDAPGAAFPDGLRTVVARHQRLFRIAPSVGRWGAMRALDAAGLGSARDIARIGKRAFVKRFADHVGGEVQARTLYESASVQAAHAANLLTNLGAGYQGPAISTVPNLAEAVQDGLPEWRTLFGSIDFCACAHCRSILSPAAYLTDLLHWLEGEGALQPLRDRRPDLFALQLSCENTNTVVPYVDLVIEVLENRVAALSGLPTRRHPASTLPSEVLLAHPEYLDPAVYDEVLAEAVYPFDLPFDLTARQGRVYLEHQGVRRADLMEVFQGTTDLSIASEHLGLTTAERRLVTGQDGHPQAELWGYPPADGSWRTTLAAATEFLERSGLSFPELLDLLHVGWVNPEWRIGLASPAGASNCDLAQMQLQDAAGGVPDTAFYDRARRFVRLWRKFDGSILDLDKVLIAFGASEIDDAVIESLSHLARIREGVRIDRQALLSLWSDIDTKLDRPGRDVPIVPLYDRVFLDRAVITDAATWPFQLDANRELTVSGDLSSWTVELQAALGVTAEELDAILEPGMVLTLPTLSRLYRTVVFARALKLPVGDVLAFRDLFATLAEPADPFVADDGTFDTRATLRFVEEVRAVAAAGFTATDIRYLLGHDADAALAVGPDETTTAAFLTELQAGLRTIEADAVVEPDPTGEITQQLLSEIVDPADLDLVLALIDGHPPADPVEEERLYTVLALFVTDTDPRTAGLGTMPGVERYGFVLARLVPYLATVRKERLIRQKTASHLALDPAQSDALLVLAPASVLGEPTAAGATDLLQVLLSRGFVDAAILTTASDHPAAFAALTLLDKIAKTFGKLEIGVEEQTWLLSVGLAAGMLDPAALPLAPVDAAALYPSWRTLREALRLRDVVPGSTPTVLALLTTASDPAATREGLLGQLRDRTGWSWDPVVPSDLGWLADTFGFADLAAFRDGTALHTLADAFAVLRNVGVTAEQAASWSTADLTPAITGAITLAAKSDYEPTRWYEVARPLRDQLREGQRAALVSWLVHHTPFVSDPADLFADVLLDVEMDPCMLTSRIVQAIGSVQLYVQRCFLDLEAPDLGPDADERWAWMRNYRVWEANRRVFLYPENWLWPELRDDKSELFTALETDLLQAPITDDTAEQAYLNYLQGLLQISRLEIVACYHQQEEDDEATVDVLHVFGRTPTLPRVWFYRRREAGTWSPWEKADLDIEGDHLVPVVHNRRLMVFWPLFLEQALDNSDGAPPEKFLTVQLAYSERRGGGWAPKRVSEQEIDTRTAYTGNDPSWLKFAFEFRTTRVEGGSLEIECIYSQATTWSCGRFRFDDCTGAVLAFTEPAADSVVYPTWSSPHFSRMIARRGLIDWGAWFPVGPVDADKNLVADDRAESVMVLGTLSTDTVFTVSRQYNEFASQGPFFYVDEERTYFVEPRQGLSPSAWAHQFDTDAIDPEAPGENSDGHAFDGVVDDRDFAGGVILFDPANDAVPTLEAGSLRRATTARTASATITNLADTHAAPAFGVSIGPRASQLPVTGDAFAQTATGIQQAAAWNSASTYNTSILQTEDRALQSYGSMDVGVLGEPVWTYTFSVHFHPFTCRFIKEVQRNGVDGLLAPADEDDGTASHTLARQQLARFAVFEDTYRPVPSVVAEPYPVENIPFGASGAYSLYDWELFFHIPLLVSDRLRREGRFDEAMRWFHFLFDPTNRNPAYDPPYRYWKVKPFTNAVGDTIQALLGALGSDDPSPEAVELRADVEAQIAAYIADPFNPWAIARLRTTAYQKTVVIKYVQTLLEWGDSLFRQDTMESVNEATQLYVMAGEILGDRPEDVPAREEVVAKSWDELRAEGLDAFSNALVEVENLLFAPKPVSGTSLPPVNLGTTLYFCVPHNENLIALWDTAVDRLYKIRHCMNIEGVVRHLPLFQPRIDPGMLVSAAAAGGSLASAVAGLQVALPHYRFRVMVQKAQGLAANVRSLGGALLAALEKRDAEALQQLRMGHEVALLDAVRDVRKLQVEEAGASLAALERSKAVAAARANHYRALLAKGQSELETQQSNKLKTANKFTLAQQSVRALAATLNLVPDGDVGASGMASPVLKFRFGGTHLGFSTAGAGDLLGALGTFYSQKAAMHGLEASNERRTEDWEHQADLADKDLAAIDKQIEAAQVRQQIAERELANHELQREQARTVDQWMRGKYTSGQLYDWMVSQISAVHYQCWSLACDVARQAERCYQHELARYDASFVQVASWDSLRKGLLAGERLALDLDRMDASYVQNDKRELELTRNISLGDVDPVALVQLRETGSCTFALDEVLFDLDVPGLYLRRIQSVSVTVPAVVGPMAGLHVKLTLTQSSTRLTPTVDSPSDPGASYRRTGAEDLRFRDEVGAVESIVTSSGQNDPGLFRQDHDDPRYLPFERRGVISTWQLSLEGVFATFDRRSIPDVVLHLRYTARDGGEVLKAGAVATATDALAARATGLTDTPGPVALFSARQDFPDAWTAFLAPVGAEPDQSLVLALDTDRFPVAFGALEIAIDRVVVFLLPAAGAAWSDAEPLALGLVPEAGTGAELQVAGSLADGVPMGVFEYGGATQPPGTFTLTASAAAIAAVAEAFRAGDRLNAEAIDDLLIAVHYTVSSP